MPSGFAPLGSAVLALDGRLRKQLGVYEYSFHPQCLFRLQRTQADRTFLLADGTYVRAGSQILALHLWNERVPAMGRAGPTLAWARRAERAIHTSLRELARYLAEQPGLAHIAAICGDMPVSGTRQGEQLGRILGRYGFESAHVDHRGVLHRFGDALVVLMLVSVTNPAALRNTLLRHRNLRIFMSRRILHERYACE
jgi:hypothetical protein